MSKVSRGRTECEGARTAAQADGAIASIAAAGDRPGVGRAGSRVIEIKHVLIER